MLRMWVRVAGVGMWAVAGENPTQGTPPASSATPQSTLGRASTTYSIQRFELVGNVALDRGTLDRATRSAVGPAVTIPQIRSALKRVQESYRELGYGLVSLQLPQQFLGDGVVRVQVQDAVAAGVTNRLQSWSPSNYVVRHFVVQGNSVLGVEELDRVLGPVAGDSVRLGELQEAVRRLQAVYRERGYAGASVRLPQQLLTDGTVILYVDEGLSPESRLARQRIQVTPIESGEKPAIAPTFEVRRYEVQGNTLLSSSVVDAALMKATGTNVSLPQIQKALGELQLAYRERGYATVSVGLPQQQLTNAVVKVQVIEGIVTDIAVVGNRFFSSNNVIRSLPSLKTNEILNSKVFQRELDLANQNRDRQIYPTLGPGAESGTSALTLRVKDRVPLHGRVDVNNQSTPGTPEWRIQSSAQYNNLWQREHQVGVSYGFSPEAFKSEGVVTDYIVNRPLIANYGAYYRLPLGNAESVGEQMASSTRFGFDEATRQFRLPPAGSRPDLSFFASAASSDTGVQRGSATIVSKTPLLTIVSQDTGQNISINESVGTRFNVPVVLTDSNRWSFSMGLDWKRFFLESFNTNNFFITTVVTNAQGSQTIESVVSSPQPARRNEVQYLPITLGADYFQADRSGAYTVSWSVSGNWAGDSVDFGRSGYSTNAQALYGKSTVAMAREQRLPRAWTLYLRASGQVSSGALIANEQFSLGGLNSVRGYLEGDQFGDAGWFSSVELRTPFLTAPVPVGPKSVPIWLRGSVFMDYGQQYLLEAGGGQRDSVSLWGAGFGVSASVNNRLDLRVTLGWPLLDSPNRSAGDPRAYFSVGGQF